MQARKLKTLAAALSAAGLALCAVQAQAQEKVKIGFITDMSSVYADVDGKNGALAIQMAIDDFGGKVLGKPVELLSADHQNKPDIAASKSREWVDTQNLTMLFAGTNSGVALAMAKVADEKKRVFFVNGAGSSALTNEQCTPYTVHYAYDTVALARGTGSAVVKDGGKSWFFLTADYAFGQALERDTAARMAFDARRRRVGKHQHVRRAGDGRDVVELHPRRDGAAEVFIEKLHPAPAGHHPLHQAGRGGIDAHRLLGDAVLAEAGAPLDDLLVHRVGLGAGEAQVGVAPQEARHLAALGSGFEELHAVARARRRGQGAALDGGERRGAHRPVLHGAALDEGQERIGGDARRGGELHVEHRRLVGAARAQLPAGSQAFAGGGNAQGLEQRAVGHVAGVAVEIVEAPLAGVVAVDGDVVVGNDLETPGLGVVAAGGPAGQVEDFQQGFTAGHRGLSWIGNAGRGRLDQAVLANLPWRIALS